MIRAALYARVSTDLQEKEQTIQSQLAAISHYADQGGFQTTPALTYTDEGFSGSHLERPALDELRDHAREGRFDVVVVLCPDRLARRYAYQVLVLEELKRAGIEVHFCERPISESPDDQLLLQIQGAVAEYERAKILERARRGRLYRARQGELSTGVPYGYSYSPKKHGGDGRLQIEEGEAEMVRQVFAWYAQERETLYSVTAKLNASPWRTRAGRKEWSTTTVLRMLHCEWYIGRAYYNRTHSIRNERNGAALPGRKPPKTLVSQRPASDWIPVAVPPILDEEVFAHIQQRIQDNRRFSRRRLRDPGQFLLRGLVKCGVCGHAYVAETRIENRAHEGRTATSTTSAACAWRHCLTPWLTAVATIACGQPASMRSSGPPCATCYSTPKPSLSNSRSGRHTPAPIHPTEFSGCDVRKAACRSSRGSKTACSTRTRSVPCHWMPFVSGCRAPKSSAWLPNWQWRKSVRSS